MRRRLIEHSKREALLDTKQPDGASLRTHLQRAAAMGKRDSLLDCELLPGCLQLLWETFLDLNSTRTNGMGMNSLSLIEIEAWCRINSVQFTPWEFSTLKAMDSAVLRVWADEKRKQEQKK